MELLPCSSMTFLFTSQRRMNGEESQARIVHSLEVDMLGVEVVMLAGCIFSVVGLAF